MKACIQRVTSADVSVAHETLGAIGPGLVILLGVAQGDTVEDAATLAKKIAAMRIFDDADGKMNLDIRQVNGAALVVSQFTLLADCTKGNRPSFVNAAPPAVAEPLYEAFVRELIACSVRTETGRFRAMMRITLINDGPVTILLDTRHGQSPRA